MKLLVMNGPNLNFLGIREPEIYGKETYEDLCAMIRAHADQCGCTVDFFQSNHEGAMIDRLQAAYTDGTEGVILNPGAYTHYSYALHDAIKSIDRIPVIEVHISDISAREDFRKESVLAPACRAQIKGHGLQGYLEAMDVLLSDGI